MKIAQYIFLIFFTCNGLLSVAQDGTYQKQLYIQSGDTLPYRLLLPKNFKPSKKYPLLLFLHVQEKEAIIMKHSWFMVASCFSSMPGQ